MENSNYYNYFKNHYRATFSSGDVETESKWFYSQWQFINRKINIKKEDKILEIGSGLGGVYKFLKNKENYLGLELDSEAVKFTNDFFKTDKFKNCSIEIFDTNNSFDKIFAIEVLEHFVNPLFNIEKIGFLLKKGGVFIGTTPYPYRKNVLADSTHNFVLHPENWKRLFLKSGFKKVMLFPMSFIPFIWRVKKEFNPIIPFYLPFNKVISTTLIVASV